MAVYAIGDIQGCHDALLRLLDRLHFDTSHDRVWFTGDIVNRGPLSLESLRLVRSLGRSAVCVLGNHDLHLLAVAAGVRKPRKRDTLAPVLEAPDAGELLDWLRRLPLLHRDTALGWTMVHAGLAPQWDLDIASACAKEVEEVLSGTGCNGFLERMYGNKPARWDAALDGIRRLRFTTNCLTRIRYCAADGTLDFDNKGPPGTQPKNRVPWFRAAGRASAGEPVLFGHWSTLGVLDEPDLLALDTGCVWGGCLTAVRLDGDRERSQVRCKAARRPAAAQPQ